MRKINRDQYGIIGQIQNGGWIEGGDSACWNGHYSYFSKDVTTLPYVKTFEVKPGAYVRHPVPHTTYNRFGSYYKNPWMGCISRDQMTGVLLGIIAENDKLAMLRLMAHWALRGFLFSYNVVKNGKNPDETKFNLKEFFKPKGEGNFFKPPDITLFNMWAMALRGFGVFSWIFWPILCILDLHLLADTFFTNAQDDDDQINYLGRLALSKDVATTPVSWLARKILNKEHLKELIEKYWAGWRDNPGMSDLHAAAIDQL